MMTKSRWMMAAGQRRPLKPLLFVLPLLVLWLSALPDCALAAKRSNMNAAGAHHGAGAGGVGGGGSAAGGGASSNRPRAATTKTTTTTTTTTPSSITPDDWRDPYVYSLFEITLSAIDSKLRRVDSLERNMEMMLAKLSESTARSDAILTQLKVMDGRLNRLSPGSAATAATGGAGSSAGTSSGSSSSDREYSLEPRILALDEKVSQIGSKLNVLTYQLDSNSLLWAGLANYNETGRAGSDDYVSSSSEQARAYISVPHIRGDKLIDRRGSDWSASNGEDTESIRTTMASMDRHLKILIELFSEQMDKMMSAVADVRTAVITSSPSDPSSSLLLTTSTSAESPPVLLPSGRSTSAVSNAKLDQLYQKMAPLLDVSEKMDQVWNVLIGAKSSVDSLVPTSEALLWQTQRQERALTDIHAELNIKTKQIIDNLNLLQLAREPHSGAVPGISSSTSTSSTSSTTSTSSRSTAGTGVGSPAPSNLIKRSKSDAHDAGLILANKPQESQQVSVTFKQTEIPTSRGVVGSGGVGTAAQSLIRAQELSPGPVVAAVLAAAKSSTTTSTTTTTTPLPLLLPPPPEVVPIPSDIMDSEFLHDDPIVVLTANQTAKAGLSSSSSGGSAKSGDSKKAQSSQPSTASVIAAAATANISSTTSRSVLLQHIVPAGPTERSRIPNNSNVIFPSVKNKPGFTNTTFFYDYTTPQNIRGYSCAELKEQGLTKSGIYYLLIRGTSFWYIKVYCDMEAANGGWTVIQRRDDYGGDNRENFNRDWDDYKSGFGDPDHEFWLGNENIYMLTNAEDYSLRVELEDFEGNKRYAEYSSFKLYSEREQYKLEIGGYTGNAGDSLNDPWYGSNLSPFSTYNRDNDRSSLNCASMLKGGWWWKSCGRGLNGIYLTDPQDLTARQGIVWFRWRGWDYTLKRATMMIRPRHYGKEPSTNNPQEKPTAAA